MAGREIRGRVMKTQGPVIRALEIMNGITILLVAAVLGYAVITNHDLLVKQQQGRREAIAITCSVLSATTEAGRSLILASGAADTRFTRRLEKLGAYPSAQIRRQRATRTADLYVNHLVSHVEDTIGVHAARGLVNPNGSINCRRFGQLAKTSH